MKLLILVVAQLLLALSLHAGDAAGTGASFTGPIGLELYSLRAEFAATGVEATLDKVKGFGIKYVELAGTYTLPPEKFKALLNERGLIAVSAHFPYARYKNEPAVVAAEAKALGLEYAGVGWADHTDPWDEKQVRETIEVFNKAGEEMAKQGVKFFYHLHGFEFRPYKDGTLADLLISETNKDNVFYQMDVLWIFFAGQDPAKLLEKYSGRWVSMHLKDLKKGVATGDLTGHTDVANNVVLGTGQVDWPKTLAAAKRAGLAYYFIEDESSDAAMQIPLTLKYLGQVSF